MKTGIFSLILLFLFFVKIDAQIPSDSLIAFYPFNGNTNDESGNNNHGKVYGATLSADRFGNPDKSYYFDGIDDYMLFNDASFDFERTFCISFWLKTSSTGSDQRLFHKNEDPPNRSWFISLNRNETGKLTFFSSENGTDVSEFISDSVFNDDNWNHVVFIYDGLHHISKFYKNNFVAGVDSFALGRLNTNNDTLSIANTNYPNNYPEGLLDDIRIYDRVLDSSEISELFNDTVCSRIIFDTASVIIQDSISIPDTLIFDITITGINPPDKTNTNIVYPTPALSIPQPLPNIQCYEILLCNTVIPPGQLP